MPLSDVTPEELGQAMSEEFNFLVSKPEMWEASAAAILDKILARREATPSG